MVARELRLPVVLDTNVFVGHFLSEDQQGANSEVYRLWLIKNRLQLIVSPETITEHLRLFAEAVGMTKRRLAGWRERFETDVRCTLVTPGPRPKLSRDPDDNIFLATARAGHAEFLITNDRDLLDLPDEYRRTPPFAIVTPREFLDQFES